MKGNNSGISTGKHLIFLVLFVSVNTLITSYYVFIIIKAYTKSIILLKEQNTMNIKK